jgi:hypothetical protein
MNTLGREEPDLRPPRNSHNVRNESVLKKITREVETCQDTYGVERSLALTRVQYQIRLDQFELPK